MPRRSITEAEWRERLKDRPLELSRFGGSSTSKSEFRCLEKGCGHTWATTLFSVWTGSTGCPKCAARNCLGRPVSNLEADWHRKLEGRPLTMTRFGGSANAQAEFKCLVEGCGHTWESRLRAVSTSGNGCPKCAKIMRLSLAEATERVHSKGYRLVEYSGNCRSKSSIECQLHQEPFTWTVSLNSLRYHGCPKCANERKRKPRPKTPTGS